MTSLRQSNRIFRGRPRDVGGGRPGTSWGPIFADWDQTVNCGSKKSKFTKHQEAKGLLSKLGIKIPLSKVPILGDILF